MEHVLRVETSQLKNQRSSYEHLNKLSYDFSQLHNTKVTVDFSNVTFISGNFFSIIGDIFNTYATNNDLSIGVTNLRTEIADVMCKNGFSKYFHMPKKKDSFGTTIPYQRFHCDEIEFFKQHITKYIFQHNGMPSMSEALNDKIVNNMLEIFANVRDHSNGSMVHSCGQYFPKNSMLRFTISDIGTTILENVVQYHRELGQVFNKNGLKWALVMGNSTRKIPEPGGLGFSLILEFIKLNQGKFSIVSGCEGYEYSNAKEKFYYLSYPFQGTIVTMSFNLSDTSSYCLRSESKKKLIF